MPYDRLFYRIADDLPFKRTSYLLGRHHEPLLNTPHILSITLQPSFEPDINITIHLNTGLVHARALAFNAISAPDEYRKRLIMPPVLGTTGDLSKEALQLIKNEITKQQNLIAKMDPNVYEEQCYLDGSHTDLYFTDDTHRYYIHDRHSEYTIPLTAAAVYYAYHHIINEDVRSRLVWVSSYLDLDKKHFRKLDNKLKDHLESSQHRKIPTRPNLTCTKEPLESPLK